MIFLRVGSKGFPRSAGERLATIALDSRLSRDSRGTATSNAHQPTASRTPATTEEIGELVRRTAAEAYGVLSVGGQRWHDRLLELLGRRRGVRVELQPLRIELRLRVAPGLPRAAVVENVRKAIRYAVQRDVGRSIDELTVHVESSDA